MKNEINVWYIVLGGILGIFAQLGAWMQHNLQFKYPKLEPNWWGWYLMSIPITWLFLNSTKYGVNGFGGSIWANRFLGFSLGIVVYAVCTHYVFNQPVTSKIFVQILLCMVIIGVQFLWK